MTQADLQWLRSEMERVIELNAKGTPRPWERARSDGQDCIWNDIVVAGTDDEILNGETQPQLRILDPAYKHRGAAWQQQTEANLDLVVAAVNYSTAWARHVLRVIERVETENPPLVAERALLSALIADMRKDGGK